MTINRFVKNYFGAETSSIGEVRPVVWNDAIGEAQYLEAGERYQAAVLEQYKLYVEMADRVSARRGQINTFFLSLNTVIFTVIGAFWKNRPVADARLLAIPLSILVVQCAAWFWLIRSQRQLNSAKYIVVGALEERLPASPYWRGEWRALGEGRDKARYWPLTHLEQWIPALFAVGYLAGFAVAVLT